MALWLYATIEGVGSARKLARLCEEHVAFQWLCGGVSVNHKTLADFRVGHGALLERLLVDGFAALLAAGVARLDRVAQDGMRVRASAGAASFRRLSTLERLRVAAAAQLRGSRARSRPIRAPPPAPAAAQPRAAADREAPRRGSSGRCRAAAGRAPAREQARPAGGRRERAPGGTGPWRPTPARRQRGPRPPTRRRG